MEMKELLKQYKRGIICLEELKEIAKREKQNTKEIDIDLALQNKLEKEIKEFKKILKNKSKNEIINSAYELAVKEEIKNELIYMDLYEEEKEMLLLQDDVINEFYHDWLDDDTALGEVLIPSIEESVSIVTRDLRKTKER